MAYVVSVIYLLIVHPTDTYIIKQGTLSKEDESVDETLLSSVKL